jgi:hypothetical protein
MWKAVSRALGNRSTIDEILDGYKVALPDEPVSATTVGVDEVPARVADPEATEQNAIKTAKLMEMFPSTYARLDDKTAKTEAAAADEPEKTASCCAVM